MRTITSAPKLLTLLLLMMVSFSAYGYPSSDFQTGELYFSILSETDRTVSVAWWKSVSGNLEIPSKVIYQSKTYDVIDIGDRAFEDCQYLTSVTIPNSVTRIGGSAFEDCHYLTSVTIPNSVMTIEGSAFSNCYKLTSVTIPNSVTRIGRSAFSYCNLTSVTIPASVTEIGGSAFDHCSNIESINVDHRNSYYSSIEGILYNKDASTILRYPQGNKASSFSIPSSVTTIGEEAFSDCSNLESVTIPTLITTIGYNAFENCRYLTSVTIPNTVMAIESYAFSNCYKLTSVTIPNALTEIKVGVFRNCRSLTSVNIPNSVTTIGSDAFNGCESLKSVTIPNSVIAIGSYAFNDVSLTSVTIPNSVTTLGSYPFGSLLQGIYVQIEVPLECGDDVFWDGQYMHSTLYVPTGTLEAYKKVDPWRNFWNIEEMDYSGINDVGTDNEEALQFSVNDGVLTIIGIGEDQSLAIYDMHGREVYRGVSRIIENLARGIYIVKVGNKAVKVMI